MSEISDDTGIKRIHEVDMDEISKKRKNDEDDDYISDRSCSLSPSLSRSSSYSSSASSRSTSRSPSPSTIHKTKEEEKREKIENGKKSLPIYQYKDELIKLVRANPVIVCVGEAGSGKTTQIPQYLYEAGFSKEGMIVVTQPRRVAASSVCRRVCEEMNTELGKTVGYTVRFEDHTSEETKIKYMTDGSLVRECLSDSLLSKYSVIMLDEAHERSIHTDILFGFIKKLLNKRKKNIHIIITSATLQTNKFCKYFNNCPCLEIPGRLFPIDIYHNKERTLSRSINNIWRSGVDVAIKIHEVEPMGDILYFLTGQSEIEKACKELKERVKGKNKNGFELKVLPLYGSLPEEYQRKVFENFGPKTRKIIIATNIADTSITVPGIKYIIDPGYVKQKIFNPDTGIESLEIVRISQAAAQQRAGRAGRIESGKCYRLYPRIVFEEMAVDTVPEIQRSNLSNVILYLKVLGINDVIDFDYIDPPPKEGIINALKMLYALGALDKNGEITKIGRRMCEFPLEPCLSRFLVASIDNSCSKEALIICSMLSVENIFYITMENREKQEELIKKHSKYYDSSGDHFTYIKIFNEFIKHNKSPEWCKENGIHFRSLRMASHIRDQLESEIIKKKYTVHSCGSHRSPILKSLAEGFFMNIAQRNANDVYRTIVDINHDAARLAKLHPSSTLFNLGISSDYIIFHELNFTSKCFMKQVCEINKKDFEKLIPRAESIDINRLCGHKIVEEKEVVKTIGKKVLHEEERKEELAPASSVTEDKIALARRKYLERKNKKNI